MRRILAFAALLLFMALSGLAEGEHCVVYFYRNYCESCTPEEDFALQFQSVTGVSLQACSFTAWNVARQDGQAALDEAVKEYGLAENPALPLAIVDGVVYQGASHMNAELAAEALSWSRTLDSELLFLYVPACESCGEAEAALDALPSSVTLHRGDIEAQSAVIVRRLDASARPAYAQALFEAYQVPDEQRVAPVVFFADRYLAGAQAISSRLDGLVRLGAAAGGVPRIDETDGIVTPVSLARTLVTGLTAGLNTCALSMLLLFISLLLESGRKAWLPAACFLLSKLACYLLIGFALVGLFRRTDPRWLRPLARWILTGMGAVLIALNVSDAVHVRRGDFGGVRNQLPAGLRGALRRAIGGITDARAVIPAAALLGFIVAGGEFLCSGQLYLMHLMSAAHSGTVGQSALLIAYCLAFLTPSALVTAAVIRGGSQLRAARFFADHMALLKILTSVVMLILIIAAWWI